MSQIMNRDRDCLSCRLISGGGLLGVGVYMAHCSRTMKGFEKKGMFLISLAFAALGSARLLNLPPFHKPFSQEES